MNATTENACTKTVADEIWFQDISVYEAIHPLIKLIFPSQNIFKFCDSYNVSLKFETITGKVASKIC